MRGPRSFASLSFLLLACSSPRIADEGPIIDLGDDGGPTRSTGLPTSEITATFSAQAYGDGIHVYATLDGGLFAPRIDLGSSDALTATPYGASPVLLTLEPEDASTAIHYTADLPQNTDALLLTVAFSRGPGQTSAPQSLVVVPPAFAVTSTPPAAVVAGDSLPISVSPMQAPLAGLVSDVWSWTASGDCVDPLRAELPQEIAFDAGGNATLATTGLTRGTLPCDVTVQVRHEVAGTIDPAFADGSMDAGPQDVPSGLDPIASAAFLGLQARSFVVHLVAAQ
jgi:hypothetical protein